MEWYEGSNKEQQSVLLSEREITVRAEKYAEECNSCYSNDHDGYYTGWKECTEHYRELIEAGVKWKELHKECVEIAENYPRGCDREVMLRVTEKVIELNNRK